MLAHGMPAIRDHLASLPSSEGVPVQALRKAYDKAESVFATDPTVRVESVAAGSVPGELLTPPSVHQNRTVLYLHGGGYALGSTRSHRHVAADIATASGARALIIDYRLAPEHPFPAALDDAVTAYRWLLDTGTPANQIAIAGDSAGGGLTAATLLALREQNIALPACAICISPWADLTNSAESYTTRAAVDPMVTKTSIERWTDAYLGELDPKTAFASPALGDLSGLPPILIQVGSAEVLHDDAVLLNERAKQAGTDVTLEVWKDMIHVWHWFGKYLDEAGQATTRIGEFIRKHSA
ncbi:MAG: monoterpene epsilon-lactone hydrolase [Gammaproteobacteria bacterium]|jgi:monoterpene epsilon-lactone hydrolase